MAHARRDEEPLRTYDNFVLTADEIRAVVASLVEADTVDDRRRIPGMDPNRADIILGGAIVLEQAVGELGIDELVISGNALREGALLDAASRRRGATLHHLRDLRRRSVLHLAESMDDDPVHSARTASLALVLFDALARWHDLGDDSRELLEAAALLANVGLFVSHSEHHKHSYYLIRNSDRLAGFTDHEIELIALVARYHRKSAPKPKHVEFARLREEDQERVTTMAGMLRVAIALDRSHDGRVATVAVGSANGAGPLRIGVVAANGADISLELQTADERKELLEAVLGHRVEIVTG